MKFKFRAEPKDLLIFVVFSVFSLYIITIGVLNALSILRDGTLSGLNPLPILGTNDIFLVIILYIVVLILAFTGVSSYFFERDDGVGIALSKKEEKGYNRWCKDKEMKKASNIEVVHPLDDNLKKGGIPIYNNGKEIWIDTGGYHNMIIGSTGSGKSQAIAFPYINIMAKAGESMIVTDPKGELYEGTADELKKRGYNLVVLNFRDPAKSNCWNPFTVPYKLYKAGNIDKSIELLEDLSKNILYDEKNKDDPFWENTSADYFAGLAYSLFQDAEEDEVNINSITYMASVGEQRVGGSNYIKEYFGSKDPTSTANIKVNSTITAPNETKGSILSVFNQKIQLFSSREKLSSMLSKSDFDMEDIGRKKTAVFIIIQDEKKTYHSLVTIFLKQCYETLVRVAQENEDGELKFRTNFLMDEFANMPPLSDVDAMVSAARSRNMRLSFIIQNFSQLNDVYGKDKAETIRGNCGNLIYLLSTELAALEEISKMCGEVKSKKDDKTDSRPLITVTDLQNFKEEEILILRSRMRPFKSKLKYAHKLDWGMSKEHAEYPTAKLEPVKMFDLKAFVDKIREEKINNMLNGNSPKTDQPFGMGGFNPSGLFGPPSREKGPSYEDIVKKIDARIAELEEEERKEQEEQKSKSTTKVDKKEPVVQVPTIKSNDIVDKKEEKPEIKVDKKEEKPEIKVDKKEEKSVVKEEKPIIKEDKTIDTSIVDDFDEDDFDDDITDDQFFDDFFADE